MPLLSTPKVVLDVFQSSPYPTPLDHHRIEASFRRVRHRSSASSSNIVFLKTLLNKCREPDKPCPNDGKQYQSHSKIGPGTRRGGLYGCERCRRYLLMCHDSNSRHDRSPTCCVLKQRCCRNHLNLTGDDTVWVGFFTLSQPRHTTEIHRIIIRFESRNTTARSASTDRGSKPDAILGATLTSGGLILGTNALIERPTQDPEGQKAICTALYTTLP